MPDLDTAEPEEIAQDECLANKAEEVQSRRSLPSRVIGHKLRWEDLEESVYTCSTIAVTEGDFLCHKLMTPNKTLKLANPYLRGEPENSCKSQRSCAGAITFKLEDPIRPLF